MMSVQLPLFTKPQEAVRAVMNMFVHVTETDDGKYLLLSQNDVA